MNLSNVTSIRDLGVVYNNKLNFDDHNYKYYCDQGLSACQPYFRGFTSRNIRLLARAFTRFVRPLLEYCTPAWSPYLLKDIHKIENVQRYFTRRFFPCSHYTYNERLFLLGLEPLESRRLKYDIKLYYQRDNSIQLTLSPTHFPIEPSIAGTHFRPLLFQLLASLLLNALLKLQPQPISKREGFRVLIRPVLPFSFPKTSDHILIVQKSLFCIFF